MGVVSLVAFNINIDSPEKALPKDLYNVNIMLVPKWGLYANFIAQVLSQLTSHVIIHYHRRVVENALATIGRDSLATIGRDSQARTSRRTQDEISIQSSQLENQLHNTDDVDDILHKHCFLEPQRSDRLVIRPMVNVVVIFVTVTLVT